MDEDSEDQSAGAGRALAAELDGDSSAEPNSEARAKQPGRRNAQARIRALVRAINDGDDATVEKAVLDLSRSRRWLAPLALVVGAFVMLFQGVKLLFSNWRLTLIEILPAMWIWLAMFDLKVHLLHGKSFYALRGPVLIPLALAVAAITAAGFYLNAVFAFAVARPGTPEIRRAFVRSRALIFGPSSDGGSLSVCASGCRPWSFRGGAGGGSPCR